MAGLVDVDKMINDYHMGRVASQSIQKYKKNTTKENAPQAPGKQDGYKTIVKKLLFYYKQNH